MDHGEKLPDPPEDPGKPEDFEVNLGEKETELEEIAHRFPRRIRKAISGIDGDTQYAIIITLFDQDSLSFSELQEELDIHQQTLTNALNDLQKGALISRRNSRELNDEFSSYYSISRYGRKFIKCLFKSLEPSDFERRLSIEFVEDESISGMRFEPYQEFEYTSQNENRVSRTYQPSRSERVTS